MYKQKNYSEEQLRYSSLSSINKHYEVSCKCCSYACLNLIFYYKVNLRVDFVEIQEYSYVNI